MNIINKIKEHKNILMTAGGIGVTITGVILMRKASLKCKELIKQHEKNVKTIAEVANTVSREEYTDEDIQNDININNVQTTVKIVMSYALPSALTIVGGCTAVNGLIRIYRGTILNIEGGLLNE